MARSAPSWRASARPSRTEPFALTNHRLQPATGTPCRRSIRPKSANSSSSRIEKVKLTAEARNEGTVTSVSDGIVRIHGLADVMQGEMIELPDNTFALALNLERDSVGAVVLGDYEHLREGDIAKTTGRILEVPIGPELLGRVRERARRADRRQGPDQRQAQRAGREGRPGRDLAQVGVAAGADRLQVGRRHDPDRPRPARADHRRPPDRQDGDGVRRDHQPERHRR